MAVSVRKLIHRGEVRHAVRDRVALEDALHTTLPDDGRLMLVRRLKVRGELADPARRQHAVRRGWVEAVAGAVHGVNIAANRANCVWFASREEAEAMLLRKLLAGEPVDGWFWELAVPGWRRLPLFGWVPRAVAECLAAKHIGRLASLTQAFVEAGRADLLVGAVERVLSTSGSPLPDVGPLLALTPAGESRSAPPAVEDEVLAVRIAANLAPRVLPPAWRRMLRDLKQSKLPDATMDRVVTAILEERIRRASPALSLKPRLMKMVAGAVRETLAGGRAGPDATLRLPSGGGSPASLPRRHDRPMAADGQSAARARAALREDRIGETLPLPGDGLPPAQVFAESAGPFLLRASRHAGLWLVVPALIRLGFGEWLAARAELLGENPGRSLILAVARHHRVGIGDPALAPLAPVGTDEELPGWTEAWRIGLDRWLRRSARRRTHDLVRRPGKFALGEDRTDIYFPLDAADLRLRRLALDRDPGWVCWLGLSIRYHFGAEGVP